MDEQTFPPKENAVIRQLARIDLHIRRRWWRNYIANPTWTFTQAIEAAESLADNQWSFDYSTGLFASYQGGTQASPGKPWKDSWKEPGSPKGGSDATSKGKGGTGKGGKTAKAQGSEIPKVNLTLKIGACTHNGKKV